MSVSIELQNGTITDGEGTSTPVDVSALNVIDVAGGGGGTITNAVTAMALTASIDKGEADVFVETSEAASGAPWRQLGDTIRLGFRATQSLSRRTSVGGCDSFVRVRYVFFSSREAPSATLVVSGTGS